MDLYTRHVSLSRQLRTALAAERRTLLQQKRRTDERLAAIDLLLSDDEEAHVEKRQPPRRATPKRPAASKGADLLGPTVGFREVLKTTLVGRGYTKPGQVIQSLRERGFEVAGKTPLPTRVYNELKRMRREGILERDESGRYALPAA
jgi:hypothetical protein